MLSCTSSWVKFDGHLSDECLCVCNQGAFADNLTDTVDRLLIIKWSWLSIWKLRALRNPLNKEYTMNGLESRELEISCIFS